MNVAVLVLTIVFIIILRFYKQDKYDSLSPYGSDYEIRVDLKSFKWALLLLIGINLLIGFDVLTLEKLAGETGLTLFKKVLIVFWFVILILFPCFLIYTRLLRSGIRKIYAINIVLVVLFFSEFLMYKKGILFI